MLHSEDTWPYPFVIAGTLIAVGISWLDIVNINVQILACLSFLWNIHFRLYPSFLDEDASSNRPNTARPLDYPSRNLWTILGLLTAGVLLFQTWSDISQLIGGKFIDSFVQVLVSSIAWLVALSFAVDLAFGFMLGPRWKKFTRIFI